MKYQGIKIIIIITTTTTTTTTTISVYYTVNVPVMAKFY